MYLYWATSSQKVLKMLFSGDLSKKNSFLLTTALVSQSARTCTAFRTLPRALHSLQLRLPRSSQVYKVPVAVVHRSQ